jgi:hypothetical protein
MLKWKNGKFGHKIACLYPLISRLIFSLYHKNSIIQVLAKQIINKLKSIDFKTVNDAFQSYNHNESQNYERCLTWFNIYKSVWQIDQKIDRTFPSDLPCWKRNLFWSKSNSRLLNLFLFKFYLWVNWKQFFECFWWNTKLHPLIPGQYLF